MKYVALLRGIGPTNPNMRNEKIIGVFKKLGFKNVSAVISTGNIIFETETKNTKGLEVRIEKALPAFLKFASTTIVRSENDLKKIIAKEPFKNLVHGPTHYLTVTFLKKSGEVFTASKPGETVDLMGKLERAHGKEITTRTWNTVQKIAAKMAAV